jgi:hypothetical protein
MPTPEIVSGILLKVFGAFAGTIVNILFMPPKTKKEFIRRLVVSLIMGAVASDTLKEKLALSNTWQSDVFAVFLASALGWWCMGTAIRIVRGWKAAD